MIMIIQECEYVMDQMRNKEKKTNYNNLAKKHEVDTSFKLRN